MKKMRRVLALMLTLVLCIGLLPMSAYAAGEENGNEKSSWSQAAQITDITDKVSEQEEPAVSEKESLGTEEEISAPDNNEQESAESEEKSVETEEETSVSDINEQESTESTVSEEESVKTEEGTPAADIDEEEPVIVSRNSITLLDAANSEQVTVSVEGAGDTVEHTITLGGLNESNESLAIEGYDFVRAQVGVGNDYTTITGLYKIADSDEYYATIENNTTTGIRISDPRDVVLVYEAHRDTYIVTYEVWVDGSQVTENTDSIVTVTGATTVKNGSNLEFAAVVQDGYVLNEGSPTATSGNLAKGDNNTYTVAGITENVTIKFEVTESKSYEMSFNGSNTELIYNERTYRSDAKNNRDTELTYTPTEVISFSLHGWNEWNSDTEGKILNQLSISIDGVSVAAGIPDETGTSVETEIAKGYQVTVTKTQKATFPTYSVEIRNPIGGKVRGTIHIQTNFKDYNSSEVWAKQLDGTEPLAYSYGSGWGKEYITTDGGSDQNSRLQPNVYTYFSRSGHRNEDSTYYIKLTEEYNAKDLYLTVENYSAEREGEDAEFQGYINGYDGTVSLADLERVSDSNVQDYDYQFVIPADNNSSGGDDYYLSTSENGEEYNGTAYNRYWSWGRWHYSAVSNPQYPNEYYYHISGNNYQRLYWVPRDTGSSYADEYVDIRIYIQYKPDADATYSVSYNLNGGEGDISNVYDLQVNDSFVINEELPMRTDYVFDGWYLGDDPDTLYQPGDLFTITNANISLADSNHTFAFTAKWTPVSQATYASFQVQIFFQKDDGTYDENNPDITTRERGRVGTRAYIIPEALNDLLNTENPGWNEDYEYDRQDTDKPIEGNGSTVLKIFYKQSVFYVYHTGAENGSVETIKMSSLEDGTYDLTQNLTANTLYGGYYLSYSNAESGVVYDGTNATWTNPQTENGKAMHPEAGETYYVKEVPTNYLQATQVTTYNRYTLQLRTMILTTVVDDANYKTVGFRFNDTDYDKMVQVSNLSNSLTFEMPERDGTTTYETVDAGDLSGGKITSGQIAAYDYFNYVNDEGVVDYTGVIGTNRIKAYWVTPDGITVTGGYQRTLIVRDADRDNIIEVDGTVDGEKINNKEIMYLDAKSAIQVLNR